jgi:arylsulfatase A-like enzyme
MTHRNIVLIVLDSVRKDFFDSYAVRTRNESDLSYEQCRAASSWSLPSHASMLSGTLPSQHGVHTHSGTFDPLPTEDTFFHDLSDEFKTICVSANAFASSSYNFDKYFDTCVEPSETRRFPDGFDPGEITQEIGNDNLLRYFEGLRAILRHQSPLKSLGNAVLGEIDNQCRELPVPQPIDNGATPVFRATKNEIQEHEEPFFAFVNIMDAHIPLRPRLAFDSSIYDVPNDWSTNEKQIWELMNEEADDYWHNREELYAATIDYLDKKIISFSRWVQKNTKKETTVIVTADHGENHGRAEEDGLVNHKSSLSEGLLHVPLEILNAPDNKNKHQPITSHLELGNLIQSISRGTITDISMDTTAAEVIGISAGPEPENNFKYWDRAIRCAYRDSKKYIWDSLGTVSKYQIYEDRPSYQNLLSQDDIEVPQWAANHFNTNINEYKQKARAMENNIDVAGATQDRLEKLGYL